MTEQKISPLQLAITVLIAAPALYVVFQIYQSGQLAIALTMLCITGLFVYVYLNAKAYTYRYLFPGLLGFGVFVIFPLIYTFVIGFSRYEATHLLSFNRVKQDFLQQTYKPDDAITYTYKLYRQSSGEHDYRLYLESPNSATDAAESEPLRYWSESFILRPPAEEKADKPGKLRFALTDAPETLEGTELKLRDITKPKLFIALRDYEFQIPNGPRVAIDGLRSFSTQLPLWIERDKHHLENQQDGKLIQPDAEQGYFVDINGEPVGFGFRTWSGMDNYQKIVDDERVKGPFIRIFIWTVIFSALSVLMTFALGMILAVMLEWEDLKGRKVYRTLLILPYAVPAFLSILVFKGMFNQEAGAINEFLNLAFSMKPEWTTNPMLSKAMVLIVNIWLGYPYMMLIATGVLQSIPKQIYEASAIDGSNTLNNFFKLTLPLILPPLVPLLIASFAFNFNNFNLIFLLTQGGPKMVNSTGVAGETDILVTYTFNLAFLDSGNNYGLACAIATILFFIVGTLAYINLKLTQRNAVLR